MIREPCPGENSGQVSAGQQATAPTNACQSPLPSLPLLAWTRDRDITRQNYIELDDDDHLQIKQEQLTQALRERVEHAVQRCPKAALSIVDQ